MTKAEGDYIARRLEEANPDWVVHFEPYRQEFVAIPGRDNPARIILVDQDPRGMILRIRRVESLSRASRALRDL